MPDIEDGVKFSEFPSATPGNADVVVGLHDGDNAKFTVANLVLAIRQGLENIFIPKTRTVNGKALSSDITLTASDVGAQAEITTSGILKGDGAGGVSAAVAGTDYGTYSKPSGGIPASDLASGVIPTVPSAYTSNPEMDGTASPGSSGAWAKGDHVHPSDTSRVPVYGMGENLLDNADFRNPINQRGASSYTATGNSNYYSIDRWYLYGASRSLTIGTGYVTITPPSGATASLTQRPQLRYSDVAGTQMTISALLSSGELLAATNTIPANAPSSNTSLISAYSTVSGFVRLGYNNGFYFLFQTGTGTSLSVVKAKLEPGTEQTLCHNEGTDENPVWVPNEIPDYEAELIKCQTSTADSTDTYANKSLATEQELAYVETGTTASRNYAAGDYFCRNGLLHRAKTAIAIGASFTVGTNCESTTVGDEIQKKAIFSTTSSSPAVLSFGANARAMIFASSTNTNGMGLYAVASASTNATSVKALASGSAITMTSSGSTITVSSSTNVVYEILMLAGDLPTIS